MPQAAFGSSARPPPALAHQNVRQVATGDVLEKAELVRLADRRGVSETSPFKPAPGATVVPSNPSESATSVTVAPVVPPSPPSVASPAVAVPEQAPTPSDVAAPTPSDAPGRPSSARSPSASPTRGTRSNSNASHPTAASLAKAKARVPSPSNSPTKVPATLRRGVSPTSTRSHLSNRNSLGPDDFERARSASVGSASGRTVAAGKRAVVPTTGTPRSRAAAAAALAEQAATPVKPVTGKATSTPVKKSPSVPKATPSSATGSAARMSPSSPSFARPTIASTPKESPTTVKRGLSRGIGKVGLAGAGRIPSTPQKNEEAEDAGTENEINFRSNTPGHHTRTSSLSSTNGAARALSPRVGGDELPDTAGGESVAMEPSTSGDKVFNFKGFGGRPLGKIGIPVHVNEDGSYTAVSPVPMEPKSPEIKSAVEGDESELAAEDTEGIVGVGGEQVAPEEREKGEISGE